MQSWNQDQAELARTGFTQVHEQPRRRQGDPELVAYLRDGMTVYANERLRG